MCSVWHIGVKLETHFELKTNLGYMVRSYLKTSKGGEQLGCVPVQVSSTVKSVPSPTPGGGEYISDPH